MTQAEWKKTLTEIRTRALVAAGVSRKGHVEVGERATPAGTDSANCFEWAEDADLTDTFPLKNLPMVVSGLIELDLYVYSAPLGQDGELVTNVAAWVRDGKVLAVVESVGNLKRSEEMRFAILASK